VTVIEDDLPTIRVKTWGEASDVLTHHRRMIEQHEQRIEASELVTSPIRKVWAAIKWGWVPGAVLLITGASPNSPLGQLVQWLINDLPK
jgi:hypothetical protein